MNFLAGPEPNAEIYASHHSRRERQPSSHICKFTMCGTELKNTLSHTYIKNVPVTHLAPVSQHVTTSDASETGKISRNLTCLKCQTEGSEYYYYGVPNVTPCSLADWYPLLPSRAYKSRVLDKGDSWLSTRIHVTLQATVVFDIQGLEL